ncbi:MAG: sialidase family protein [Verrucomicrobia bacterium]|nr:sialidase family protein [Verrucomicrobiota bacterium]
MPTVHEAAANDAIPDRHQVRIPTIDLSGVANPKDFKRHVIVAQGNEQENWQHPHMLLMPDGRTLFAAWTRGHGCTCGPLKRSDDGGKTWSELLPVPANWKTARNCPAIYRLTDPSGVARLVVYAGSGPGGDIHESHSTDDGKTWTPMKGIGMAGVMPFCSIEPIDGGKTLLGMSNIRRPGEKVEQRSNVLAQSLSSDGGLTWTPWRVVLDLPGLKPCEPWVMRSPDGKQLLCLIRENEKRIALYMTSEDEGRTWSATKPLPPGLFGDRHVARTAPDGRLVVCFRDTGGPSSPTSTHFIAWVGRYDDIVNGRDGQYRIKLLHSYRGGDTGYPGVNVLPDGTVVATTYIKYREGPEKNSVVSTRFTLAETDKLAAALGK